MASTASTEAALETDDLLDVTMPLPQASLGMFSLTLMFIYGVKKVRYLSKLITLKNFVIVGRACPSAFKSSGKEILISKFPSVFCSLLTSSINGLQKNQKGLVTFLFIS